MADYTVAAYVSLCDKDDLSKIAAIKEVRNATGYSLLEAKLAVERAAKYGSLTIYQRCRHSVTRTTVATMAFVQDKTPTEFETFHVFANDERIS